MTTREEIARIESVADAIDAARFQHPQQPRERPRPFSEADRHDREYAFRLACAALRAMPLQDHGPKESAPTPADLLAAAREAFLDLRADAQRWDEDVDGDTDSNGRTVVYVNYHATFGNRQLEDLCEALGIRVPFGETAGDAIDRVIADGAAAMVAEDQTSEAKS